MKPAPFAYHRPRTRDEVDALLADLGDDAKVLAGGQSLIPVLNMRLANPEHLVDINTLDGEASDPALDGDQVTFGPLVRKSAAEKSAVVAEHAPLIREALGYVAHPPVRNRGTFVGSIAHADPAAELPAVLVALDGSARLRSREGSRVVAAGDLFVAQLETVMDTGEWMDEVSVPVDPPGRGTAFGEFARRHGDYALCGVAATADIADGNDLGAPNGASTVEFDISLTYLGMGQVPTRIDLPVLSESEVAASRLDDAIAEATAAALEPEPDLHASAEYRMWLANSLGARVARRAVARSDESEAA